MTSQEARDYLDRRFGPTRDLAGVVEGDWFDAVDEALLALGQPTTTDPYPGDELGFRAVLRWAGLRLLWSRLDGLNVNISDPGIGVQWGDALKKIETQLAQAADEARPYAVAGPLIADAGAAYGIAVSHSHGVYARWP